MINIILGICAVAMVLLTFASVILIICEIVRLSEEKPKEVAIESQPIPINLKKSNYNHTVELVDVEYSRKYVDEDAERVTPVTIERHVYTKSQD